MGIRYCHLECASCILGLSTTQCRNLSSVRSQEMTELIPKNMSNDHDVLVVADLYGTIASVSDSVEAVFGYDPDSLVGQNVELFVPIDLRSKHRDHMARFARRPHARTMGIGLDLNGVHADGTLIPVEVSLRVFRERERTLVRAVIRPTADLPGPSNEFANLVARIRQLELTSRATDEVYELVAEQTSATYENRAVAIWRYSNTAGGYVLECFKNLPNEFAGLVTPREDDGLITRAAFVQGVAIYSGDPAEHQLPELFRNEGLLGGIAATIGGRYEPYGAITVYFGDDDALQLSDAAPLQAIATEVSRFILSAQTEGALSRESDLQGKLAEIGRIFSSSNRIEDVYQTFAELVNELIPYKRITLAEIDHGSRTITTRFSINSDGSDISGWESGTTHDLSGTSAERMAENLKGLYMNFSSPEEFSEQLPGAPDPSAGLMGVLNVPLIVSGDVVGTLTLNSGPDQVFDDESMLLGERIAAQISGSFLSASLSESLEREAARRGTLNEIGEVITSSLDLESVFPAFGAILQDSIDADFLTITDVDVETATRIDFIVYGDEPLDQALQPLEGSISGVVADRKAVVSLTASSLMDDDSLSVQVRKNSLEAITDRGMSSWVAAPLMDHGDVVGVLHILSKTRPEYDADDCEFIGQIATRVASAVVNSRLHEAAREYARRQEVLAQISREIGSSLDTSETFDRFVALLSELVPVDRVAISNVDVSNQTAETLFVSSSDIVPGPERVSFRTGHTPTGQAADIGETVVINRPSAAERFTGWIGTERGIQASVTVPMGRDGDFARIFQVSTSVAESYGPEQISTIEQVANQIAGAVANQQLYRRSIELSQERERSIRLEAETARLESVNQAKNDFLNLLTHELKTPLTSIIAFADLLSRSGKDDLSSRQAQHLQVIQRNAWQLDALIQDLVDVSSIERGTIELNPLESDICDLVAGVIEGLQPSIQTREQTLDFNQPDEEIVAKVDRQRITQVISNLISNASKYSPANTTVYVNVESMGDQVMVSVEDEGPGIPETDLRHVFELFHRVDNEITRQVPGTGQGLYLVKQLVELHGGSVRIGNRYIEGKGTRAVVMLPVEFAG